MNEVTVLHTRWIRIIANGEFSIALAGGKTFNTIETRWDAEGVSPGGILSFSVDGDPGVVPGEIDLSATGDAGSRVLVMNGRLNGLTIAASTLPVGGAVLVKLNG